MAQGIKLMWGSSSFQTLKSAAEPYLVMQRLGPMPIGIILGAAGIALTLLLLENKRFPAGLIVVGSGMAVGLLAGTREAFDLLAFNFHLPEMLPFGLPSMNDFSVVLLLLVLPQIPMTIGNAVVAYADLSTDYFGEASAKVTYKNVCLTIAAGNALAFLLGGMPLCHGAGGLAAHYRFGARTAGSNLIIGLIFLLLALFPGHGHSGHHLSDSAGNSGCAAALRRQPALYDHDRPDVPQGPFRGHGHAGHHPGHQSGSGLCGWHCPVLCTQIQTHVRIKKNIRTQRGPDISFFRALQV
jgi:hypothetical protein